MVRWVTRVPGATVTRTSRERPSERASERIALRHHSREPTSPFSTVSTCCPARFATASIYRSPAVWRMAPHRCVLHPLVHNAKCFFTSNFSRRRALLAHILSGEPFRPSDQFLILRHAGIPLYLRRSFSRTKIGPTSRVVRKFFFNTVKTGRNRSTIYHEAYARGYKRRIPICDIELLDRRFVTLRHTRECRRSPKSPVTTVWCKQSIWILNNSMRQVASNFEC